MIRVCVCLSPVLVGKEFEETPHFFRHASITLHQRERREEHLVCNAQETTQQCILQRMYNHNHETSPVTHTWHKLIHESIIRVQYRAYLISHIYGTIQLFLTVLFFTYHFVFDIRSRITLMLRNKEQKLWVPVKARCQLTICVARLCASTSFMKPLPRRTIFAKRMGSWERWGPR